MTIHPNAASRLSKSTIADPQDLLRFLLASEPRLRRKDAEREVIKRFEWWNPWKPGWRPAEFSLAEKDSKRARDEDRRASYQSRREEVHRQRRQRHQQEQRRREQEAQARQRRSTGFGVREESITALFEEGDEALANWTVLADASSYDDLLVEEHQTADDVIKILLTALKRVRAERDQAISLISTLVRERTYARAYLVAQGQSSNQTRLLYRKVGLDEGCPEFVLKAARLALRRHWHPDGYPERDRAEAERRFKDTESVFEEITRLRGR